MKLSRKYEIISIRNSLPLLAPSLCPPRHLVPFDDVGKTRVGAETLSPSLARRANDARVLPPVLLGGECTNATIVRQLPFAFWSDIVGAWRMGGGWSGDELADICAYEELHYIHPLRPLCL